MNLFYVILIIVDEIKKVISKNLLISILAGFFNILFSIYIIIMGNHGYVDKATGVFVYETYYLTVLDFIIIFLFTPCFLICMIAGISSIVNDFKVNERKRVIITIFGLILLLFFNFGGITFISNIFGPQK